MRFYLILFTMVAFISCQPDNSDQTEEIIMPEEEIDLAEKWGADEYGMKKYVMAFLKKGPNRDQDSTTAAEIQKAHLQNIEKLVTEGKMVLAGPFLDASDIQGIFLYNVESIEEAEELTSTDPAVKAGRLIMELHPWYGSAAVMGVTGLHYKMDPSSIPESE